MKEIGTTGALVQIQCMLTILVTCLFYNYGGRIIITLAGVQLFLVKILP